MALTNKQYKEIKEELDTCKRPLFFFHDDPDGLCSFLQFFRHVGAGKGVIIKTTPNIDGKFFKITRDYEPDKVFILDIAGVEQDYIDEFNIPIIWIDHHIPLKKNGVKYYNPRVNDPGDNMAVSYICYKVLLKDLWISLVGAIGDMYWPVEALGKFRKEFPLLLPKKIKKPREAMFGSGLGRLGRIFSFALKGNTKDALSYVKVLTRINDPYEILEQKTAQGRYIYKKYEKINKEYKSLLKESLSAAGDSPILLFTYPDTKTSFTGDLANELSYRFPDKVIIIAREKSGEMKCSLRTDTHNIPQALKKALTGLQGYGGGHEHAAGCVVKFDDFPEFLKRLEKEFNKEME